MCRLCLVFIRTELGCDYHHLVNAVDQWFDQLTSELITDIFKDGLGEEGRRSRLEEM